MVVVKGLFYVSLAITSFSFHVSAKDDAIPEPRFKRYQAFCTIPVADVVGTPLDTIDMYHQLPWDYIGSTENCPRLDQLLLHEQVTVLNERDGQACIELPTSIFYDQITNEMSSLFWVPITTLTRLSRENSNKTPSYDTASGKFTNHVVTLAQPWYDTKLQQTLSAGTNFVVINAAPPLPIQKKLAHTLPVWRYNNAVQRYEHIELPTASILDQSIKRTHQEQRKLMVHIARTIVRGMGKVPYTWGGASYTVRYNPMIWTTASSTIGPSNNLVRIIDIPIIPVVKTGFDCSGLIRRTARMAGIPIHAKNSTTLKMTLESLKTGEQLEIGDIIFIPGHVMIVSDIAQAKLIEARGALHDYGYVHEIPLSHEFKDVTSYEQLIKAHLDQEQVTRIDCQGCDDGKSLGKMHVVLLKLPIGESKPKPVIRKRHVKKIK